MKYTLSCIRRADQDWDMIKSGDRVAVGVSGGKDSALLLKALSLYKFFSKNEFDVEAITIDMGFEGFDPLPMQHLCDEIGIPYTVVKTDIAHIVFNDRKEKNPCALCSRMRRGVLHDAAKDLKCNKLALGHTIDDALETLFMSMLFEGRINTFSPYTYMSRKDITVIRPLVYMEEGQVINTVKRLNLPIIKSPCPADGYTKRQDMKELIESFSKVMPQAKQQLMHALIDHKSYNLWDRPK